MNKITIFFTIMLLTIFPINNAHAYVVLSSKTTVSPGCDGGISSRTTISMSGDPYETKTPDELEEPVLEGEDNVKNSVTTHTLD